MPAYAVLTGGMGTVIETLDRFGGAIEYDLHAQLGLDLLDFARHRYSWAKLLRLLQQLPWWSRYQLAVADDDDIGAEALARERTDPAPDTAQSQRPDLVTWDPMRELQATVVDGFNAMISAQSGKKNQKPKQTPRPDTGRDRAKRAATQAETHELFQLFAPDGKG